MVKDIASHKYTAKVRYPTANTMVYTMVYEVDGGCRNNGYSGAIAAAAAIERGRYKDRTWTRQLDSEDATNQRAEITAIILALEQALRKYRNLKSCPTIDLTIRSDSRYAVNCMTEWIYKWTRNGWRNAAGRPVVNKDLIRKASELDDEANELGDVTYEWIPRSENIDADEACNDCLDEMERYI